VFQSGGGFDGVNQFSAERTWGPPSHVYTVEHDTYTVITWSHLLHVTRIEPRLTPTAASSGPA